METNVDRPFFMLNAKKGERYRKIVEDLLKHEEMSGMYLAMAQMMAAHIS